MYVAEMPVFSRYYEVVYTRRVYVPKDRHVLAAFAIACGMLPRPLLSVDFYFPITE